MFVHETRGVEWRVIQMCEWLRSSGKKCLTKKNKDQR